MWRGKCRSIVIALLVLAATWSSPSKAGCNSALLAETDDLIERRIFNLNSGWIRGSVALGDLNQDGVEDVVVGSSDGVVLAYDVHNASELWHYDTGDAVIEGKAAIGDINADGNNEVVIGTGSCFTPLAPSGIWAFAHDGTPLWFYPSGDFAPPNNVPDGVYSTPALADVDGDGKLEIIYGGWDAYIRALNDNGTLLWELFTRDTVWSSPAIGDIDRDGKPEVAIGSDAHWEPDFGTIDGGKIYVLNGEDGSQVPGFFKQVDEVVWSSPALGDINGDGWLEIVVGTGDCYEHADCASGGRTHQVTDALYAWDHEGNQLSGWPIQLSEYAFASPALGDLDGDGDLEIIVNTNDGYVHAFHADGSAVSGWPRLVTTPAGPGSVVHLPTWASPVLADLTGDGSLEVILPSNWEIVVWDHLGNQLTENWCCPVPSGQWVLLTEYSVGGTPALGDVDGEGKMELVVAGARAGGEVGALYVWDFDDALANGVAPWSCFRRDGVNHANHGLPPALKIDQASLFVMHEYGSGSSESCFFLVANSGGGEIEWQIVNSDDRVAVMPSSGVADWWGQLVEVSVSTSGLGQATYSLEDVQVVGIVQGEEVGSASVSVTLYVGTVHKAFVPSVWRYK